MAAQDRAFPKRDNEQMDNETYAQPHHIEDVEILERLEPLFPGDQELERRIKSLIRWNALAMVVRANREEHNIGGHISTYASAATLYEVGFNHFFRARTPEFEGDTIYFQGHAAPGIY